MPLMPTGITGSGEHSAVYGFIFLGLTAVAGALVALWYILYVKESAMEYYFPGRSLRDLLLEAWKGFWNMVKGIWGRVRNKVNGRIESFELGRVQRRGAANPLPPNPNEDQPDNQDGS